MTAFKLNPFQYEKWIHQNKAFVTDIVEGCLLDSVLVQCSGGVAAMFETALNDWSSCFTVYFARYGSEGENTVYNMWDTFAGAAIVETA